MIYMYIERYTNHDFDRLWLRDYHVGLQNVKICNEVGLVRKDCLKKGDWT